MPLEHQFTCPLSNGVHARPASSLEELARGFASEVILINQRTQRAANGKSVLALVSADIRLNDPCLLTVTGSDESEAMRALSSFLTDTFPHCDDLLPPVKRSNGEWPIPPGLRHAGATIHRGTPVVPGIAQGRMVQAKRFPALTALPARPSAGPDAEWDRLDSALQALTAVYDQQLTGAVKRVEAELIRVHRSITRDLEFCRQLRENILRHGRSAAGAIADAEAYFTSMLAAGGSALLRERALDIQDVCFQLLRQVYGDAVAGADIRLTADSVVIAESLTPGQFLALDRRHLKGLVLAQAGGASHTVILARSFGVPTIAGVHDLAAVPANGEEAVVDADIGALVTHLTDASRRYYAMEYRRLAERQKRAGQFAGRIAASRDGSRLEIGANISTSAEAAPAFAAGAEGIGLFRTEMLFLGRDTAPGETKQFEAYRATLEGAGSREVIIRTLDIGGDKPLGYLKLAGEENPFLGYRAVRIYPEFESLFRIQARALIRASAHGRLKVLIPMITTVEEARWVKKIVADEQSRCAAEGVAFDAGMPLGAMIEVPAAAFAMDALCREFDFFSIGSNDLLQYFVAADRSNVRVAGLYDPLQPSFLRLLKRIVDQIHARRKWVGLCGEMAGQARFLPLLAALGLDEISVPAPAIGGLKAELAGLALADCTRVLAMALECATAGEVATLLKTCAGSGSAPLLDPELVLADADAASKAEAIKLAVDRLYVLGRTEEPRLLEEAIWQRELVYSTGFGHGFAIPHGKSDAVRCNSLVLVKLRAPVEWDSLDGLPVRVMILLVMRETGAATEHLKVFAQLARQIMHDEFRSRIEKETDAAQLCAFLCQSLQV